MALPRHRCYWGSMWCNPTLRRRGPHLFNAWIHLRDFFFLPVSIMTPKPSKRSRGLLYDVCVRLYDEGRDKLTPNCNTSFLWILVSSEQHGHFLTWQSGSCGIKEHWRGLHWGRLYQPRLASNAGIWLLIMQFCSKVQPIQRWWYAKKYWNCWQTILILLPVSHPGAISGESTNPADADMKI